MLPQARFDEFLKDIEPSPTTKSNASSAHTALREYLKGHDTFKEYHVDTYLSGSYKRDTAIRPNTKNGDTNRPDVDIIVETNHTIEDDPNGVVDLLYTTLEDEYPNIRPQDRSVGIESGLADMDVVPIITHTNGVLYIPDRKLEEWLVTNPPKHISWTTSINKQAGGRFKPLVKMMKWWRRENNTGYKKPKGFVTECIVAECMNYSETYYGKLFVELLEGVVRKYTFLVANGQLPHIEDPGVNGNSVTDGMTVKAFEAFCSKVKSHSEIGRKALNADNEEDATNHWRRIFGDRFPAPKVAKASESLLGGALTPSLSFPDEPVKPNKPQGFAG